MDTDDGDEHGSGSSLPFGRRRSVIQPFFASVRACGTPAWPRRVQKRWTPTHRLVVLPKGRVAYPPSYAWKPGISTLHGRAEAEPVLKEAAGLAQELGNTRLIATTLDYQGDRLFYGGDFAGAKALYEQAGRAAEDEGDPYLILGTRADLARAELMAGQAQRAIPMIDATLREAASRGVGYLETRCTICMGSALLTTGDLSGAEQRLRKAIGDAEDMGARDLLAQSHHLLAETLRASGNESDAARSAAKAAEYLEEIRTEAGSDALLARADLAPVAEAAGAPTPQ